MYRTSYIYDLQGHRCKDPRWDFKGTGTWYSHARQWGLTIDAVSAKFQSAACQKLAVRSSEWLQIDQISWWFVFVVFLVYYFFLIMINGWQLDCPLQILFGNFGLHFFHFGLQFWFHSSFGERRLKHNERNFKYFRQNVLRR